MKYVLLFLLLSCTKASKSKITSGDCVLGGNMQVWKLLRQEDDMYLFAKYPLVEGTPVEMVTDISAFKKVDCPPKK